MKKPNNYYGYAFVRTESNFIPNNVELRWIPRELNATVDKLVGLYKNIN